MKFKDFDKQMRQYELVRDTFIPMGGYTVVRLDGRSFSKLTNRKGYAKPFDDRFKDAMSQVAAELMKCGFDVRFVYVQSDEINILFDDECTTFNRKERKWLSILAGVASSVMSHYINCMAVFDARVIWLPDAEACHHYFTWRQGDSERNCLNSYCYWTLINTGMSKHKAASKLDHMKYDDKLDLLTQYGINYDAVPRWHKYGYGFYWKQYEKTGRNGEKVTRMRVWRDEELPHSYFFKFIMETTKQNESHD